MRVLIKKTVAQANKERYNYYTIKHNDRLYNYGVVEGENFCIYRIRDNKLLHKFNLTTFLPS